MISYWGREPLAILLLVLTGLSQHPWSAAGQVGSFAGPLGCLTFRTLAEIIGPALCRVTSSSPAGQPGLVFVDGAARGRMEVCKADWILGLERVQHHSHHILLARATHKAAQTQGWEIDLTSRWEKLWGHIVGDEATERKITAAISADIRSHQLTELLRFLLERAHIFQT